MRSQSSSRSVAALSRPFPAHQVENSRFIVSASLRVDAYGMRVSSDFAVPCSRFDTRSRTLTMRWFQHRCSAASGYTLANAPQMPR